MEQVNIGGQPIDISPNSGDVCILCDWDPPNTFEKKNDLCTCCDSTDWVEKDE